MSCFTDSLTDTMSMLCCSLKDQLSIVFSGSADTISIKFFILQSSDRCKI